MATVAVPSPGGDRDVWGTKVNNAIQSVQDGVDGHGAAVDPHGDRAAATTALATHVAAADPHGDRANTTTQIATHAAAADPHGDRAFASATFIPSTAKDANNGVPSLTASGKLNSSQLQTFSIPVNSVGDQQVATILTYVVGGYARTVDKVFLQLGTAAGGADLIVTVTKKARDTQALTLLTTLTFTAYTVKSAAVTGLATTLNPGDTLIVAVTQVGSVTPGSDLNGWIGGPDSTNATRQSAPAAPTSLAASLSSTQVTLTWTASASGVRGNVAIYRAPGASPASTAYGIIAQVPQATTTYVDSLPVTGTYSYVVRAENDDAASAASTAATANTALLSDTFTATDGTAWDNTKWTVTLPTSPGLVDQTAGWGRQQSGTAGGFASTDVAKAVSTVSTATGDQRITATVRCDASPGAANASVRSDAAGTNRYQVNIHTGTWTLNKRVGGTTTQLATGTHSMTVGSTLNIDLSAIGTTITYYEWTGTGGRPGTPTATVTDSAVATGTQVLYVDGSGTAGQQAQWAWDNVVVTSS